MINNVNEKMIALDARYDYKVIIDGEEYLIMPHQLVEVWYMKYNHNVITFRLKDNV